MAMADLIGLGVSVNRQDRTRLQPERATLEEYYDRLDNALLGGECRGIELRL